ncbi:hypothetical protein C8R47DRAFT_1049882, partial [Mycena vitilis]
WNSAAFLKYFKKSQNLPKDQPKAETNYVLNPDPTSFGNGPIPNTFPRFIPAIYYFRACAAIGVPFNPLGGSGINSGVWSALSALDPHNNTRVSSATAYLEPNRGKQNLTVITHARAVKILFAEPTQPPSSVRVAERVLYVQEGGENFQELTVTAKKEVILCAGAFRSPQILELSGSFSLPTTTWLASHIEGIGHRSHVAN